MRLTADRTGPAGAATRLERLHILSRSSNRSAEIVADQHKDDRKVVKYEVCTPHIILFDFSACSCGDQAEYAHIGMTSNFEAPISPSSKEGRNYI